MSNSPWSKVPKMSPVEMDIWEHTRDMRYLQIRIDYLGEGYPSFRNPRTNVPEFQEFKVGSEEEMMKMLEDILEGKL